MAVDMQCTEAIVNCSIAANRLSKCIQNEKMIQNRLYMYLVAQDYLNVYTYVCVCDECVMLELSIHEFNTHMQLYI